MLSLSPGGDHMKLDEIANKIQNKLLNEGFIIHRYNAYSTNSIYLKLDYGVGNSIRISDHRGKRHLQYRYNVLTTVKNPYEKTSAGGYTMLYYNPNSVDDMVRQIIGVRENKLAIKSQDWYKDLIQTYKSKYTDSPGFWRQAFEVRSYK